MMKYCLKYTNLCKNLSKVDEIQIQYIEDRGLLKFMEKFAKQRIILAVGGELPESELNKLKAIHKQYPEYRFAVGFKDKATCNYEGLVAAGIDFFIREPCQNWEYLTWLLKIGVSDVNLSGALAFEFPKVKYLLDRQDRKVNARITPNIVQSILPETDSLVKFYIRPEDMEIYEQYIDILEFEGLEHQDTFLDIYQRKIFIGNLNQCIYNFSDKVDNKGLSTLFGERRVSCGQQCLKGGRCRRCYDMKTISVHIAEKVKEQIAKTIKQEQEKIEQEKRRREAAAHAEKLRKQFMSEE